MPTNLLQGHSEFSGDVNVLATEQGLRSPRMVTFDLTYLQPGADGQLLLRPGSIITRLASGLGRVYPATKATAATATTSDTLTVDNPTVFKVGDTLKKTSPTGTDIGTIASIDVEAKTLKLAANAATAIANGNGIFATDGGAVANILGITISLIDLRLTSNDVACYTSASVYGARLPYWDANVQAQLPEITLV